MFAHSVWEPARSKMFPRRPDLKPNDPRQPKLSRLRRHDLRHAACSWWLREGVDAVVCQRWSGHRTLSVFLDIYQGVAPGREDEGVQRLVRSLRGAVNDIGDELVLLARIFFSNYLKIIGADPQKRPPGKGN